MVRNRDGDQVDPVPYLVVVGFAFLGCFIFGPVYALSVGLPLPVGVAVSGAVFLAVAAVAYHRMVWTARPDLRSEVPARERLVRLLYAALVTVGLMIGLTIIQSAIG